MVDDDDDDDRMSHHASCRCNCIFVQTGNKSTPCQVLPHKAAADTAEIEGGLSPSRLAVSHAAAAGQSLSQGSQRGGQGSQVTVYVEQTSVGGALLQQLPRWLRRRLAPLPSSLGVDERQCTTSTRAA